MNLVQLLKWAKCNELCIEIYGDGGADVEGLDGGGCYKFLCDGGSLYKALVKAKKLYTKEWRESI